MDWLKLWKATMLVAIYGIIAGALMLLTIITNGWALVVIIMCVVIGIVYASLD